MEIGASCEDIRLQAALTIQQDRELPIRYTADSTVGELLRSRKGRAFLQGMLGNIESSKAEHSKNLGEGSADMVQNTMLGMPLHAIVTFGHMTREQLDALLTLLNTETEE